MQIPKHLDSGECKWTLLRRKSSTLWHGGSSSPVSGSPVDSTGVRKPDLLVDFRRRNVDFCVPRRGPRAGLSPQLPLWANVFRPRGTLHARGAIWEAFSRKRCVVCSKKRSLFGPVVLDGQKICDDQQRCSALARGIGPQRRAIPQYGCDGSASVTSILPRRSNDASGQGSGSGSDGRTSQDLAKEHGILVI